MYKIEEVGVGLREIGAQKDAGCDPLFCGYQIVYGSFEGEVRLVSKERCGKRFLAALRGTESAYSQSGGRVQAGGPCDASPGLCHKKVVSSTWRDVLDTSTAEEMARRSRYVLNTGGNTYFESQTVDGCIAEQLNNSTFSSVLVALSDKVKVEPTSLVEPYSKTLQSLR